MQLCGRAGRSGRPSRAHLFYMPEQKYCTERENCRRLALLRGIGSSEELCRNEICCDVCVPVVPYPNLEPGKTQRRQRCTMVRKIGEVISERLKTRLLEERERIMDENPSYRMVSHNFVCPDAVIAELCKQVDDLDIFCLRPQLRSMDAVGDAPPPKRKSKLH